MMDQLAKQQACQLFIEQEIEKGLAEGKTKYAIGHEIASWIKKLFEVDVNPKTIAKRAERIATNVANKSTYENHTENEEIQDEIGHGGARVGTGRPTKFSDKRPTEEDESVNLMSLKLYWHRATKKDRKAFLEWTNNN